MPLLQRKCACGGGCPRCQEQALLQTKLKIGEPGDKYEQEADRIAEQVMQMPEPSVQRQVEPEAQEELQRQPLEEQEEEEETLQTKPLAEQIMPLAQRQAERMEEEEEEEKTLQTKTTSGQPPTESSSLQNRIKALQGGGQPLPQSERAFFEPRFGADFSQVRVHADSQAAETASAVNSRAFTLGQDVVFGAGQYQPSVSEGRRLLAHELTHVVQQSRTAKQGGSSLQPNIIQKMNIRTTGRGPHGWQAVPNREPNREDIRLQAAERILERVIRWRTCREYFRDNCPGGTYNTAREVYAAAQLWKNLSNDPNIYGEGETPGDHISYTQKAYIVGRWTLAATIIHELMHNCGQRSEEICERALYYCGRLPQVPVRDSGGIQPVRGNQPNRRPEFIRLVLQLVRQSDPTIQIQFMEGMIEGERPYGCLGNRRMILVDLRDDPWQVSRRVIVGWAGDAVTRCLEI